MIRFPYVNLMSPGIIVFGGIVPAHNGGGLMYYIRSDIPHRRRDDLQHVQPHGLWTYNHGTDIKLQGEMAIRSVL